MSISIYSLKEIFEKFELWKNLPNKDQYLYQVLSATDNNGEHWVNINENKFLMFVFGFVDYGYMANNFQNLDSVWTDLIQFLSGSYDTIDDLEFSSPTIADASYSYEKEIDTMVYKPKRGEGIYTCKKCKSTNIDTQALQLRSADEPVTVLAHCENCGFGWKDS